MKAFHGDKKTKDFYIKRVIKHRKLDNLTQGLGWDNGKGCAVGCTLENYNHKQYEVELGIPEWLARVEDTIFEGLNKKQAMFWPEKFLKAIKPGVDLDKIKIPFIIFVLKFSLKSMKKAKYDSNTFPDVKKAMDQSETAILEMIKCHTAGTDLTAARSAAWSAESAAWSAAESAARSAARSAAWSAAWSAESAAWSAESAARSAAESAARSAAWSAESAAWSAAESAESAARSAARSAAWSAESAAWSAAESAEYKKFADQLLKLIKECK